MVILVICKILKKTAIYIQSGSNMTGTYFCVNKPHMSRSYLNHLVGHILNLKFNEKFVLLVSF